MSQEEKDPLEKLLHFVKTASKEEIRKFFDYDKHEWERNVRNKWIEKFKVWAEPDINAAIEKLITKYDSMEYYDRERRCRVQERTPLLWLAYHYAVKYCKPCRNQKYLNMFTHSAFYIGDYVIQCMIGQGSVVQVEKIKNKKQKSS